MQALKKFQREQGFSGEVGFGTAVMICSGVLFVSSKTRFLAA
jgi:hypothetical protein